MSYATWKTRLSRSAPITTANRLDFIEPSRVVTVDCPSGYYCPLNTNTSSSQLIFACPIGTVCSEGTITPIQCDNLSLCGAKATFQLNFVNIIFASIITIAIIICAQLLKYRQSSAERKSRSSSLQVISQEQKGTGASSSSSSSSSSSPFGKEQVVITPSSSILARETSAGLQFEFSNLSIIVGGTENNTSSSSSSSGGGLTILNNLSGIIPAGTFAAIMGPTACGKSTLLAELRKGGATATSGTVNVYSGATTSSTNNAPPTRLSSSSELSRRIGYVPQEDILDRTLTVRELFTFNARARRPELTAEGALFVVQQALSDLALTQIADTVIGGGFNAAANISGGQLKRVNIGCELVALQRPAALLLDEPTGGLDASVANDVCATLDQLSRTGITILMVIQQPRPEIFEKLRHLVLMQKGSLVYEGVSSAAAHYFRALGYKQPGDCSDADFSVDVLNGIVENDDDDTDDEDDKGRSGASKSAETTKIDLPAAWLKRDPSIINSFSATNPLLRNASAATAMAASSTLHADKSYMSTTVTSPTTTTTNNNNNVFMKSASQFMHVVYLNAQRGLISRLRNRKNLVIYSLLHVLMAAALSSGFTVFIQLTYRNTLDGPVPSRALAEFCPSVLRDYCRNRNQLDLGLAQLLFFMSTAIGSASGLAAIPLLGAQQAIVTREASNGLSPIAFAAGRMMSDTFLVLWNALIFSGVWLMFGHSGHWYAWLGVVLPTCFAASGIGYAAAVSTRPVNAAVITLIATTAFAVFSGVEPTFTQIKPLPVVNWIWYLSYATWTAEGTYVTWTAYMRENPANWLRILDGATHFGYDISSQGRSIGALIGIGIAWRVVAAYVLWSSCSPPSILSSKKQTCVSGSRTGGGGGGSGSGNVVSVAPGGDGV